uniref:Putative sodium chloride cotransporter 69 n=1 Tax=Ixodes ricinus TaxID=34613 RepID=A0A0K8R9V0_IXORI
MLIPYLLTTPSQLEWLQAPRLLSGKQKGRIGSGTAQHGIAPEQVPNRVLGRHGHSRHCATAQRSEQREFEELVRKWRRTDDEVEHDPLEISDSEMLALKDKTYRHLRLRELLQLHSKDATLVAMTLPMPRKSTCSASMYMAWLETLTRDMPPFLLVRGNQTSVLTFYS